MECLDDIIGLSRTVCECYTDESSYNESLSGFFLDELEGLNLLTVDAAQDCTTGNVWELLGKSRTVAINDFKADIMAALTSNYKMGMATFSGIIGKTKWNGTKTLNKPLAGLVLIPKNAKKGTINISQIHLAMNTTGNYEVYLYSSAQNIDDGPLETVTISGVASTWVTQTVSWSLDMTTTDGSDIIYYLVYNANGAKPMDNALACCGFRPTCKSFGKETTKERVWYNYMKVGGIQGNDLEDLQDCTPMDNNLYGMRITTAIRCDAADVICDNVDFEGNGNSMVIAKAIQYKSGFHVASMILSSTTINRYTMLDREELFAKRNGYQSEYQARVDWLAKNMNITLNGCWQCEQRIAVRRL